MNTTEEKISVEELKSSLQQFYGTELYYKYGYMGKQFYLTDGIHYLSEVASCYWLLDVICSYQGSPSVSSERFQTWRLKKLNESQFEVRATNGNGKELAYQFIPFSDFPLDEITIWKEDNVLLLPQEH